MGRSGIFAEELFRNDFAVGEGKEGRTHKYPVFTEADIGGGQRREQSAARCDETRQRGQFNHS